MPKVPRPWQRRSTGEWFICMRGKQRYLGKDRDAAFKKYARLMLDAEPRGDVLLRQLVHLYRKWVRRNRSPETYSRRVTVLRSFLRAMPKNLKADQLKPHAVQRWANRWANPTTRGDRISTIKTMYNWAVDQGYLDSSPIRRLKRPPTRVRQEFIPERKWIDLLLLATDDEFYRWLRLMLWTGCRVTEMFKLTAGMYHDGRFTLPIEKSKGRQRSRVIYVPSDLQPMVRDLIAANPTGPLFRNSRGLPWDRNSIRCRFRRLKKEMGMPNLTATTLRHSFAHWRLTNGQDALTVAKLMGHVDTTMLARRYGHIDSNVDYMRAAAENPKQNR